VPVGHGTIAKWRSMSPYGDDLHADSIILCCYISTMSNNAVTTARCRVVTWFSAPTGAQVLGRDTTADSLHNEQVLPPWQL
jgi:hypothetical protein